MLPLHAFSPSTLSQHRTHAVTFPSETITCAPYAIQNAWCVNPYPSLYQEDTILLRLDEVSPGRLRCAMLLQHMPRINNDFTRQQEMATGLYRRL